VKSKPIFRIFACLVTAGIALLTVQTVVAGRVHSILAPWLFRHVPYMIYWGYAQPAGGKVTWGGPDYETLYIFTENNCVSPEECIYPDGLFKTGDYGLTWEHITTTDIGIGFMNYKMNLLATHPISSNLMFSVAINGYHNGLYRSVDYGETWTRVLPDLIYDIEFDPNHPNVMYLSYCCSPKQGIYRSDDYGVNWTRIAPDMFNDLEMVGDDSGVMFGARYFSTNDYEGVYRSPDRGLTWVQLDVPYPQDHILLDPQEPERLYAFGAGYYGISRSDDSGTNWSNITHNLPTIISPPTIQSLFYDQGIGRLWCGLKYGGMWYSDNFGDYWQQWNYGIVAYGSGIYGPQCTETGISPKGNYYAICSGLIHFNLNPWLSFLPIIRK
jgi:hypothetical protein